MNYRVVITLDAKEDLDRILRYILYEKRSRQAAQSVLTDFENTIDRLSFLAGSIKYCDNPTLNKLGYKRINFKTHRYFMLYRISDEKVVVDNIFHELEDFENKMF